MKTKILLFLLTLTVAFGCTPKSTIERVQEQTEWIEPQEGESINGYTRIGNCIYGGDANASQAQPLKVDINSFEVCRGSGYARDIKHVYYPIAKEYDEDGKCRFTEYVVKGMNPEKFLYVGNGYAIAGKKMYYKGHRIKWNNTIVDHQQLKAEKKQAQKSNKQIQKNKKNKKNLFGK